MGNLFFPKMAGGNLVRNRRFVFPYLLTGLLTVAMFYNMTFMTWHQELKNLPGGEIIPSIMSLGTVVVGLFSVIFLLYTNVFLMKRRQKEIGLYNILGMSKRHIALVLFWETLFTCLITILGGILLGILLSKLLLLILYKLLTFSAPFGFQISFVSVGVTAALFAGIYFLALVWNLLRVRLAKPVELLKGGSVGEKEPKTKWLLAILGFASLGAGYYIALTTESPLSALMLFFLAVILVIVGTYCLFTAGSIAFLKAMKKRKNYYYQAKHFIGVSGMLYRMKQNAVGLANICILSTMVLVMVGSTVCAYIGIGDVLQVMYPNDISYTQRWQDPANPSKEEVRRKVTAMVQAAGLTPSHVQETDTLTMVNGSLEGNRLTLLDQEQTTDMGSLEDLVYTLIYTNDGYAQLTGTDLGVQPGQAAIYTTENEGDWETLDLFGTQLTLTTWLEGSPSKLFSGYSDRQIVLVVADEAALEEIYQGQFQQPDGIHSPIDWTYALDFDEADDETVVQLYENLRYMNTEMGSNGSFDCQAAQETEFYTMYGSLLFLGFFLGALFLMATVLIIYYKQISEGYEDKERFAILEKVGMSQQQVKTAIRSQVRTVFFLPLAGAVIHLAASFKMISKLMLALNLNNLPLFALCCLGTVAAFAIVYFLIYSLTARTYYRIVR